MDNEKFNDRLDLGCGIVVILGTAIGVALMLYQVFSW